MDNGIDIVLEEDELEVEIQADFLKGDKGDPGYTPVRGIDYYTEQDKQELIDELTEDIQGVKNDFNTNVATKTNEFNANVVSKTTEFNNNATNKMAEFNANTITKINEYNENAEDLINRVIEAEAENERLRNDLSGLPTGQAEGETIDITDSAEMRFSEFNVRGNSKQETVTDNLFNNTWEQGVIASETGIDTESTTMIRSDYIKIYPNHLYSISRSIYSSYMSYRFYDKDKKYLGNHIAEGMMTYSTSDGRMNENESSMTFTILNTDVEYMRVTDGSNNLSTIYTLTTEAINPDYPSEVESNGDNVNLFEECNGIWYDTNSYKYTSASTTYGFMAKVKPSTTYTISKKNQGNRFIVLTGAENVKVGNSLSRIAFSSDHTITNYTFTTQENEYYVFLGVYNGTNESEIALAIEETKLEKGKKATRYSEYGQGCINEVICNKNLFDKDTVTTGMVINRNTGNISTASAVSSYSTSDYCKVKSLTTYYLGITYSSTNYGVVYYDKDKNYISGEKLSNYFTTPSNCEYVRFTWITADYDISTIQLEEDATSTAFEEHQSQTYTIPTQQPMRAIGDIRDTFVKVNGKWYERHNVNRYEFTGTENWKHNNGTKFVYVDLSDIKVSNKDILAISNSFKGITQEEMLVLTNDNSISGWNDNSLIVIRALEIVTEKEQLENFKTWLQTQYNAGTPVYVDYILATPTDIECTEEQTAILDEIENTAKSYEGITHIYSTDTVSPIIDVTYFKEITPNGDTLPVGTIIEYEGDTVPDGYEEVEDKNPVVLWEGDFYNINETATLNDSISNYKKIVVMGRAQGHLRNSTFYTEEQTEGDLSINFTTESGQSHFGCIYTISGTTFTITKGWAFIINSSGSISGHFFNKNQTIITKIIGYKE